MLLLAKIDNNYTKSSQRRYTGTMNKLYRLTPQLASIGLLLICSSLLILAEDSEHSNGISAPESAQTRGQESFSQSVTRSTQASIERQVDAPASSVDQKQSQVRPTDAGSQQAKAAKPKQSAASLKKASLASQQNYDKYQLKASNSNSASSAPSSSPPPSTIADSSSSAASASSAPTSAGAEPQKKPTVMSKPKMSSFSLLKKLFPSLMSSAATAAAAAAASAAAATGTPISPHSRSGTEGVLSRAGGKLTGLLGAKKIGGGAVPDHTPFFVRKPSIDRQSGGFASGLLSNPLGLGLLFSAPLIPSLLLTPLAIAGLSPAMSALNNLFGDDDEATASTPASSGPLAAVLGSSSALSSFLQSANPAQASSSSSSSSSSGSSDAASSSSSSPSFALQAMQSLLGPVATTERPLFKPGLFASQVAQASGATSSSSGSSASSSSSSGPIRNFLGGAGGSGSGGLLQTAASMISPSFAAPPSSSSSSSASSDSAGDSDGPGFMQVASDVFDKVASYMGSPDKEVGQAAASSNTQSSPFAALAGLSSFSPLQLGSLLASSSSGSPLSSSSSPVNSPNSPSTQKTGFFTTLKNIYELFSSSFLRRQEIGDNSNECHQRLICELHQRSMNSKLFRRSLQNNLMELASFDKSLQEQMRLMSGQAQARIDSDTKTILSDFLKASNNFKNGRELVNCSKMFPKCSRVALLSTANAHLNDPASGKAIGKFANLMKKMKFKAAQQHQSQWKLRKANKSQLPAAIPAQQHYQPIDYLQVAPLASAPSASKGGQLSPADSLKLVQQIMFMSQQQQQQQQQPQQPQQPQQYAPSAYSAPAPQLQAPFKATAARSAYQTYPPANLQVGVPGATYTDALLPVATDSPYFSSIGALQSSVEHSQQANQQASGAVGSAVYSQQYAPSSPLEVASKQQPQQTQPISQQAKAPAAAA